MTLPLPKNRGALEVILFEDNRFRGSFMFTSAEVTLGSDPSVMIRLADPTVAPCHAVMRFDGENCTLENYDEKAGTRVNGIPIDQQPIETTDEVAIGRYRLRIAIHRADATPAPIRVRPPHRPSPIKTTVEPVPAPSAKPTSPLFAKPVPPPFAKPTPPPFAKPTPPPFARSTSAAIAKTASPPIARHSPAPATRPAPPPIAASPVKPILVSIPTITPTPVVPAPVSPPTKTTVPRPAAPAFVATTTTQNDDDDDDEFFEPTFSLIDRLCETDLATHPIPQKRIVEIVHFRHGCVQKLRHLKQGEKLRLPGHRKPLGRSPSHGGFVFHREALPELAAIREQGLVLEEALWRGRADKRGRITLDPSTQVIFPLASGDDVLVHLVPSAEPIPKASFRLRISKLMLMIAGISLGLHLVVFAIVGLTSLVKRDYISENKEGRFARIALKEIELEPPPPPPKHEKKKAKSEPSQTASAEKTPKPSTPRLPRSRLTMPQAQATAQKLLSALGGLKSPSKISSATAMSNLNAVGPVKGIGGFKVSGAIGKLPGDSLRLAGAGSGVGRLDTKSTGDMGKDLGRVLGRGPSGQVRAQVTSKPNAMKVEGHLDRGEIQRVINSHIHELQGCFERQLIVHPTLAGKVAFEWVIGTNGAVKVVKIKSSTLSSNEATSCMQAAIRRWQFPSPKGGHVTVVYPIALANSGT